MSTGEFTAGGNPTTDSFMHSIPGGLPYKGLMGTCGQSEYVFRDFCLKRGIDFHHFALNRVSFRGKFLKQGIVLG